MSTIKKLRKEDVRTTRVPLHESIPVTGSLISGTYSSPTANARDLNIKTYGHGMFQSLSDYPFLSSSANQIADITVGVNQAGHYPSALASGSEFDPTDNGAPKFNIYTQMAQVLYGFDITGAVEQFRISGSYDTSVAAINDPIFINFSRLLTKDEIKKGSFRLTLGLDDDYDTPFTKLFFIGDYGATASFNDTNSPAGEYGVLRSGSSTTATDASENDALGIIYYQAGVVVLDMSASADLSMAEMSKTGDDFQFVRSTTVVPNDLTYTGSIESGSIDQVADALRNRIYNIEFDNTTELNSTIYFCRAGSNEFNFSSNPTYLSQSKIIVKENNPNNPASSYITTVGLYADDGALVAEAKLSEPLRKSVENEFTIRVRLDY